MKAILKYDFEWTEKNDADILIRFYTGIPYEVIHTMESDSFVGKSLVVIINEYGSAMSVSSHPDYVTIINDNEQELIDKLRREGIGE